MASVSRFILLAICANLLGCSQEPEKPATKVFIARTPCNDTSNPPPAGVNGYACIDTTLMSPDSYCLRAFPSDAQHVRGINAIGNVLGEALVVTRADDSGQATIDRIDVHAGSCAVAPVDFMGSRDKVKIKRLANDLLEMRILDASTDNPLPYFVPAMQLHPGPKDGLFFWTGQSKGVDFFVMLADDQLGDMGANHYDSITRIEQYLRIEAFVHSGTSSSCDNQRPDFPLGQGVVNFHPWKRHDNSCDRGTTSTENGSGGGGHDYP